MLGMGGKGGIVLTVADGAMLLAMWGMGVAVEDRLSLNARDWSVMLAMLPLGIGGADEHRLLLAVADMLMLLATLAIGVVVESGLSLTPPEFFMLLAMTGLGDPLGTSWLGMGTLWVEGNGMEMFGVGLGARATSLGRAVSLYWRF